MVRDGTPLTADEATRTLQALLRGTSALLDDNPAQALLARCCQVLCEQLPWLRLAWAWHGPVTADSLQPQVMAGPASGTAQGLRIAGHGSPADDGLADGMAPSAASATDPALLARRGQRVLINSAAGWSSLQPDHAAMLPAGTGALLALPLGTGTGTGTGTGRRGTTASGTSTTASGASNTAAHSGALLLYADDAQAFDRLGLATLDAVADLLGHVLGQVLARAAHPGPADGARLQAPLDPSAATPLGMSGHGQGAGPSTDPLTGLPDRAALAALTGRMRRSRQADPPSSLVLLNLDHFKRWNQTQGRAAGDALLRQIAQLLRAAVRQGDCCLRWSGDGFLLALPGASGAQARLVVEKLRQRLRALDGGLVDGPAPTITASFGVADLQPGETLDHAIARVEAALTAAKRGGRNRVVVD